MCLENLLIQNIGSPDIWNLKIQQTIVWQLQLLRILLPDCGTQRKLCCSKVANHARQRCSHWSGSAGGGGDPNQHWSMSQSRERVYSSTAVRHRPVPGQGFCVQLYSSEFSVSQGCRCSDKLYLGSGYRSVSHSLFTPVVFLPISVVSSWPRSSNWY